MSSDLPNAICRELHSLRSGSLTFWGNWFGRPLDNVHGIAGAGSLDDSVVVYFDHGETLIIEAPQGWSLDAGCLAVRDAKSIRFQWFCYGPLPSRDTLQFEEYRRTAGGIEFITDFQPGRRPQLDPTSPAVQLHPGP